MKREMSEHAKVALLIRQELKRRGIKGRVTSSTFAGGTSVTGRVKNQPPWVMQELAEFCAKFKYGRFDGMTDSYEYTNNRDDIPQVKYLSLENTFCGNMKQQAFQYLIQYFAGFENFSGAYEDHINEDTPMGWMSQVIWQVCNGSMDARTGDCGHVFWEKENG